MEVRGQLHTPATLLQYSLDRMLDGPQSQSGYGGEDKKIPAPAGNQTPVIQLIA